MTDDARAVQPYPKIELHVHLEGSVRPRTLLEIAKRNDYALPAASVEGLVELYRFTDFADFIRVWFLTTDALQKEADYHQMVVEYAREAAGHGAVYIEGIFSPAEHVRQGCSWEEVFDGACSGAQEARELHGVEIRFTPDITRGFTLEEARETVEWCARYRERGVVGVGLGGPEAEYPPELYEDVFAYAKSLGLASVPHAGEVAGASSIRGALEKLGADRIRHGIRIYEDPDLVDEVIARGIVLDVCPTSNIRTNLVASIAEHPLPRLVDAGLTCSVSTDDPAMFDIDLASECDVAVGLGLEPRDLFAAGVSGALCDAGTKQRLRGIGEAWDWTR